MNWEEIKKDAQKIYPTNCITVFVMDTEGAKPATHWVDKGYENYLYKSFCPFNCLVVIDLTDEFNNSKSDLDSSEIENYFVEELRKVCICHIIAKIATVKGLDIELYVDNVENVIEKFNELENNPDRLVNFDCEITEDEDWDNIDDLFG